MVRVVVLEATEPKSHTRFRFLSQAIIIHGAKSGSERNFETIRREARLLTALDSISEADENGKPGPDGEPDRKLTGGTLKLQVQDHAYVEKCVESVQWHPRLAREVVDLKDFLTTAPTEDTQ